LRKEIGHLPEATGEEDDAAYERVMTDRITANQQTGTCLVGVQVHVMGQTGICHVLRLVQFMWS